VSTGGVPRWLDSSDARRVDQLVGIGVGQRGQPGRVIAENLGGPPAEPEHHERPEHWLLDHADQHFDAAIGTGCTKTLVKLDPKSAASVR
jgi:hypothetical protein